MRFGCNSLILGHVGAGCFVYVLAVCFILSCANWFVVMRFRVYVVLFLLFGYFVGVFVIAYMMCVVHVCTLYVCMYPCTYLRMPVNRFDLSISLYVCRSARLLSCLPASIHLFISFNVMTCHIMFLNLTTSISFRFSSLRFTSAHLGLPHIILVHVFFCFVRSWQRFEHTWHNTEVAVLFMRCLLRHACWVYVFMKSLSVKCRDSIIYVNCAHFWFTCAHLQA